MPKLHITLLPEALWPLLNKFYRSHNSPMRAVKGGQLWVVKEPEIVAGLCLRPVADGQWLSGLFVDPARRSQGLAARLIGHAAVAAKGPVWLLCHPGLEGFYQRLGFSQETPLPPSLAERLTRYKRNKPMIAMGLAPLEGCKREDVAEDVAPGD